ncbi:Crp/Fnr family transcriptional regulator [Nocardioides ferulae]|uniref:Crp/Fnr family transcriptional regulator n=1 Tax=Nocardioides ferulae TaxID=2340821 RepID=UPI000EB44249|nr:Crp/Fnr family transcriptional regulator [Nocardioides ferulae]
MSVQQPVPESLLTSLAFLGIDETATAEVLAVMVPVDLRRNQALFHQDEEGASLYVVQTGMLKLSRRGGQAAAGIQALFGAGDVFGEMSLLGGGRRSGTVVAVTPSTVLELPQPRFDEWLEERPWMAGVLLRHLARRLRSSSEVISDLVFADVTSRVAKVLVRLGERFGVVLGNGSVHVDHQLTQVELAQLVGAARESVNKALASLTASGYIELRPKGVTILKPQELEAFSR